MIAGKTASHRLRMQVIGGLILAIFFSCFLSACTQKVIDPAAVNYNVSTFSFEDYKEIHPEECKQYFNDLLPLGMDKSEVEKILVHQGNAKVTEIQGGNLYTYDSNRGVWKWTIAIRAHYDQSSKLTLLSVTTGSKAL